MSLPEFAWPWMFLALPLPWLLRHVLRPVKPAQALNLPQPGIALVQASLARAPFAATLLLALAWLCLVVAAARPQHLGPPEPQRRSGRATMLAVDLSGSMSLDDMQLAGRQVTRFAAVEAIAGDFIDRRAGDELGLILFGSQAYLVTPLTYDLDAVRAQLHGAVVGLPGRETAIGDALAVAVKRLAEMPEQARVVVLLTDGVNNAGSIAPREAARAAKAAGVRVYTIGIGANAMRVPDFFGSRVVNPSADLDVGMLTDIANQTGGRFFRATDTDQLAQAYRAIDALEPVPQEGASLRPRYELFRWPLIVALILFGLAALPRYVGGRAHA
ncbi:MULTISPECIES: VWA domain-containing protein [unclassified Luteibacter]|uniref:VWA domain-containing protein n=1 Tax=unclassified Luteibacter TaxID=2620188 RepID=UPI0008CEFED2|nr:MULTISPECIES: VWA domain-containing protein [unclassified Luteibacter]SEO45760.1 Ca-activated chloride channel family protein [Luteibacter sp. UNC138MFCol5.1]SEW13984.1 Ca-activated chloride channel family protein [Luteibacter sp. 329MFSha]